MGLLQLKTCDGCWWLSWEVVSQFSSFLTSAPSSSEHPRQQAQTASEAGKDFDKRKHTLKKINKRCCENVCNMKVINWMLRSDSLLLGQRQVCKGNGHFRYRPALMSTFTLWDTKQMILIQPSTCGNNLEISPVEWTLENYWEGLGIKWPQVLTPRRQRRSFVIPIAQWLRAHSSNPALCFWMNYVTSLCLSSCHHLFYKMKVILYSLTVRIKWDEAFRLVPRWLFTYYH